MATIVRPDGTTIDNLIYPATAAISVTATNFNVEVNTGPEHVIVDNFPTDEALTDAELRATPVPVSGTVTVGNFPTDNALTDSELRASAVPVSTVADGTWSYYAGTDGTPSISGRVVGITATGGSVEASFTINGGSSVTVPANFSIEVTPSGNLTSPTIVFTDTVSYFVEVVS